MIETGILIAYLALGAMAVIPIYLGSINGIKFTKKGAKKKDQEEEGEFFSLEDAKWFPVIGSVTLFSLYLVFKYFDKEHINMVVTTYFTCLGVLSTAKVILAVSRKVTGWKLKGEYHLLLKGQEKDKETYTKEIMSYHFGPFHLIALAASIFVGAYYAVTKHWIVSNFYGEAFAASAIQLLNLDSFRTGMILLAGLFFYDIFWVFGTEVMVTVAKNFDAPIKVVFPKDIFELVAKGLFVKPENVKFTMLGLGDIVIPGIFVALCLQFDYHQYKKTAKGKKEPNTLSFPKPYFITCFIAYFLGLVTTVVVMHTFQAAQPALLYLSPACILSSFLTAVVRGEVKDMFAFAPNEASEEDKSKKNSTAETPKKKSATDEATTEDEKVATGRGRRRSTKKST